METLASPLVSPDFSTVLSDPASLVHECAKVEVDLRDMFNAFCFKCRRITMSVPTGATANEQICYLRFQVGVFQQLQAYGLVVDDNPHNEVEDNHLDGVIIYPEEA